MNLHVQRTVFLKVRGIPASDSVRFTEHMLRSCHGGDAITDDGTHPRNNPISTDRANAFGTRNAEI